MANENAIAKPAADEAAKVEPTRSGCFYRPNVDILENDDELVVLADVPGAKPDEIDVKFEDGVLTVHARVEPRQDEDTEYLLHEYGVGDYCRTFQVGETVDADKIKAEVRKVQRKAKLADRLEGKHVVRSGVRFHVLKVDKAKGEIVVSDAATPEKVKQKFSLRLFLSKAVKILGNDDG